MSEFAQELSKTMSSAFLDDEQRYVKVNIDEIPVMQAEDGSIVCIPKDNETFTAAIVGFSGRGKSLLLHEICDHLFWHWCVNVAMMYDVQEETFNWCKPMTNRDFAIKNHAALNEEPMPLPIVYVFPNTVDLSLNEELLQDKNYLIITVPFRDIIEDLGKYITGINPGFAMDRAGMYLNDIKDKLRDCDTPIQVMAVLEENLPGRETNNFQAMREKILTAFRSLFNEQILDITNPEYPPYIRCYNESKNIVFEGNPFSVLMKAGVLPCFITSNLAVKKYKSEILAFHVNNIFENHLDDFPNEKTFLVFDELKDVCDEENSAISQALGRVSARGRMKNVGLVYATQFYDKIPKSVKGARLNYCFCFQHSSNELASEIASDFDLDSVWKNQLKKLKNFECIAMTKNKFIHYKDSERWESTAPVKGKIFYPLSDHKKPGS